ncbi:MAG: 30S ribosomal protein S12 methylthiotransferase RimO, partial [Pirellulales bacterium]
MKSLPVLAQSSTACGPSIDRPDGSSGVKGRYSFISLGCPKNLVDSERMLGLLRDDGYELVSEA